MASKEALEPSDARIFSHGLQVNSLSPFSSWLWVWYTEPVAPFGLGFLFLTIVARMCSYGEEQRYRDGTLHYYLLWRKEASLTVLSWRRTSTSILVSSQFGSHSTHDRHVKLSHSLPLSWFLTSPSSQSLSALIIVSIPSFITTIVFLHSALNCLDEKEGGDGKMINYKCIWIVNGKSYSNGKWKDTGKYIVLSWLFPASLAASGDSFFYQARSLCPRLPSTYRQQKT